MLFQNHIYQNKKGLLEQMYSDNETGLEAFTQDSWAICCYVFLVSLLCEGINVSNGVLMVSKPK